MGDRQSRRDERYCAHSCRWRAWLAAVGGGVTAGLALPTFAWPPLLWLALALLWSLLERPQPRWTAACWGALAVMISHRWLLALHPLDWIGVPAPLSLPICWLLLLFCSALAGALLLLWSSLAIWLQPRRFSSALLLACSWGLAEVLLARGPLFWVGLGAAALPGDPPLAGLAALGGAGLVAAVQLLIGWGLWRLLAAGTGRLRPRLLAWLGAGLAVLALHGLGAAQLQAAAAALGHQPTLERVLLVQPAIPTREKFGWQARRRLQQQLQAGLAEAVAGSADLVLLPEGALGLEPVLAQPTPVELLSGGFRWQQAGAAEPEQRSALLRFAVGERRFSDALDKHRLVPLGEWVPLTQLVRWSGLSAVGGVQPGASSRLLPRPAGSLAAAICYEISDGAALAEAVDQGGGWLLASANLDPYPLLLQQQFTALARLRAIETGRWLVSVANTGPSQLIAADGRVVAALPANQPATRLAEVPVLHRRTMYGRWRETPLLLGLLAGAAGRWFSSAADRPAAGLR
ncbi:MAG: apolipoprotein N-acyltransferase [Cyanobacteria bacterium]|nr:apolipoprotein N-acyltransferase [Cyanobacteriota bacterium]